MRCRFGFKLDAVCVRLEISDSDPERNATLSRVLRLQLESQTQFVASSVDVRSIDQGRERQLHSWTHTHSLHQTQATHGSNTCLAHIAPVAAGAKHVWGGHKQTESTGDLVLSSSEHLVNGIFVKIKPNCLSSGDIALASSLISTCLSTDELLLSGTRVVENAPIT